MVVVKYTLVQPSAVEDKIWKTYEIGHVLQFGPGRIRRGWTHPFDITQVFTESILKKYNPCIMIFFQKDDITLHFTHSGFSDITGH